ncbi:UdgX family uracil-DNA binding protein [Bosea sp. BK604]|uniref:UdgX family uracil-DNA binding protein n=1 Tax=Bosea sp. BK604 TaxID=2512180 RepID=UPI0010432AAC|nr:UdgX family uracil-DNA binding protein [Bosea sp. BK604]TCR63358.1 DNA polymerase [Bosea sp. BK604]
MVVARLAHPADFEGWREQARALAQRWVLPEDIAWHVAGEGPDLFAAMPRRDREDLRAVSVPRAFPDLAESVICHSDPGRFALLYRLLWRLQAERDLLKVVTDPDIYRAEAMARSVRRDIHKMTAFVRFREVADEEGAVTYVAWFEPEHHIVERAASFFVERFTGMRWSILTPRRSLHWDGETLHVAAGASRLEAPGDDAVEACWRTYYASIFNPARLKVKAMKAEMPVKYWRNLPEAGLISSLIADADKRTQEMVRQAPTLPPERHERMARRAPAVSAELPEEIGSLAEARIAAADCQRCGLYRCATQTVFGEGPQDAPVVFVGEQPGDQEDLAGKPFVGPAGKLFDRALAEAGLDRSRAYVTNAVKHFKFEQRGKRRIHQRPNAGEVRACRFWVAQELAFIRPRLVVALGATALQALTGKAGSLTVARELELKLEDGTALVATVHPSFLLRVPDEETKERELKRFIADLQRVGQMVPEMRRDEAA